LQTGVEVKQLRCGRNWVRNARRHEAQAFTSGEGTSYLEQASLRGVIAETRYRAKVAIVTNYSATWSNSFVVALV